jgi:hypothetical protein
MRLVVVALGIFLPAAALSASVQLVTPMDYFWIALGPTPAAAPHQLYGASNPAGTWFIGQWGTNPPSTQLGSFQPIACSAGQTSCYIAIGSVNIMTQFTVGGAVTLRIQSTGQNQPCTTDVSGGGNPYELNSITEPISNTPANFPGYPSGTITQLKLNTLSALNLVATTNYKYAAQNVVNRCPPPTSPMVSSQVVAALASMTFGNASTGQTLFYQLALRKFGYVGHNATTGYFASILPAYGYSADVSDPNIIDNITGVGGDLNSLPAMGIVNYNLNILPSVLAAIAAGGIHGFDTNVANWATGGVYVGHVTYGNIALITEWSNVSLTGVQ